MALNQRSALAQNNNVGGTDLVFQEEGDVERNLYGEETGLTPT